MLSNPSFGVVQSQKRKCQIEIMAKDIFHDVVRSSLEAEGWEIVEDPMTIKVGDTQIYIDLSADKMIAANKDDLKIAVEIKKRRWI